MRFPLTAHIWVLFCACTISLFVNACPILFDAPTPDTSATHNKVSENREPKNRSGCTRACSVHCAAHNKEDIIAHRIRPDINDE